VANKDLSHDIDVPKWDVALAALAKEECAKKGAGMSVDDLKRLAIAHSTRFDDLVVTIFELTLAGEWRYRDAVGKVKKLTRKDIDDLYVNGRIHEKDMKGFDGTWSPA